jgi:hypothetical protein
LRRGGGGANVSDRTNYIQSVPNQEQADLAGLDVRSADAGLGAGAAARRET